MGDPFVGAGVGFAVLAAMMLASQAIFIRIGTSDGSVSLALMIVLGINVIILAGGTLIAYYPNYGVTPLSLAVFVGAGLTGTVLARSLYFLSIERIGASRTEPIKSSQPLHATFVAVLVLNEVVTSVHLLGIVLIVVGIAAVSWETNKQGNANGEVASHELLFPFAAAFFFGVEPTFVKMGFAEGTPVFVGLAIKTVAAAIGFTTYLWATSALPTREALQWKSTRWYLAAGVANTVFLVVYFFALDVAPVALVVPIVQSSPLIVLVIAYLFLDRLETVTWRLTAAATVAVLGTIIVTLAS